MGPHRALHQSERCCTAASVCCYASICCRDLSCLERGVQKLMSVDIYLDSCQALQQRAGAARPRNRSQERSYSWPVLFSQKIRQAAQNWATDAGLDAALQGVTMRTVLGGHSRRSSYTEDSCSMQDTSKTDLAPTAGYYDRHLPGPIQAAGAASSPTWHEHERATFCLGRPRNNRKSKFGYA